MNHIISRSKRSYHSDLILQYKFDLLPPKVKKEIPSSTLHNWRKKDIHKFFGYDDIIFTDEKIALLKTLAAKRNLLRLCKALYIAFSTYDSIINKLQSRNGLFIKSKDIIIPSIEKIASLTGMTRALRFFQISHQQFYSWKHKNKCQLSAIRLCFKRHPLQLSSSEITRILFYHKKFIDWDLKAIYYQMMKDKSAFMSLSTWYKYCSLLGLKSAKPSHRRKKYSEGLRTIAPKKIIHMDVTVFRPLDNTRIYIYLIVDNFSRCILAWKASLELKCSIALETLNEACLKHDLFACDSRVDLIVDGGSENNCHVFNNYIELNNSFIRKLVAQKDILFSNSMVEAAHKQLKYGYLFKKDLADFEATVKYLGFAIEDHSNKPHGALFGLSPLEALNGAAPDKYRFRNDIAKSRAVRIERNRKGLCEVC